MLYCSNCTRTVRTISFYLQKVRLQLWDTAGQENFDKIRILCYENTKCFIVCFSVVDEVSFSNVKHTWVEEVRQHQPSAKILLVGTKSDLRGKGKDSVGTNGSSKRGEDVSNNTSRSVRPIAYVFESTCTEMRFIICKTC